jgi:hypothetical protein
VGSGVAMLPLPGGLTSVSVDTGITTHNNTNTNKGGPHHNNNMSDELSMLVSSSSSSVIKPIGSPTPLTRRRNTHSTLPALPVIIHPSINATTAGNSNNNSNNNNNNNNNSNSNGDGIVNNQRRHSHTHHHVVSNAGDAMKIVVTRSVIPGSPILTSREYFPMSPPEASLSEVWEKKKRADSLRKEADVTISPFILIDIPPYHSCMFVCVWMLMLHKCVVISIIGTTAIW